VYDVGDVEYEFIGKNCNQYFFVLEYLIILLKKILINIHIYIWLQCMEQKKKWQKISYFIHSTST
jgi:hypothetical protein